MFTRISPSKAQVNFSPRGGKRRVLNRLGAISWCHPTWQFSSLSSEKPRIPVNLREACFVLFSSGSLITAKKIWSSSLFPLWVSSSNGLHNPGQSDSICPERRMWRLLLARSWHSLVTGCARRQVLVPIPYTCLGKQEVPVDMNELILQ